MGKSVINMNPALQTSYKLIIPGLDSFNYFMTAAEIPGMTANGIESAYRDRPVKLPSDRCDYDPLNIDFLVAEDFANHAELRTWMWKFHNGDEMLWGQTTKDIIMMLMNSNMVPMYKVVYYNAFPTQIGSIRFDTAVSDDDALHASATFMYQYYDVFKL